LKIRSDRLKAWLKRLQWPLSWKGFLRPVPAPASLHEVGDVGVVTVRKDWTEVGCVPPAPPAPEPVVVEKIVERVVYVEVPAKPIGPRRPVLPWTRPDLPAVTPPAPKPVLGQSEEWKRSASGGVGEAARVVLPPHVKGGRHVVTGASAAYTHEAEGHFSIQGVGDFCGRKVKGRRQMNWAEKPPRGLPGESVEIVLQGVAGARGALSVCGYTEWEMSDAQN
jgi:hypothetical protein